jgi:chitinase
MKQQNPNLKTLLSLGGWNFGSKFTTILATPDVRQQSALTSISFLRARNFDGLDLDFEYPGSASAGDKQRYTLLLQVGYSRMLVQLQCLSYSKYV